MNSSQTTMEIERSIIKRYRKSIWRRFTKAVNDYKLIEDGDGWHITSTGRKAPCREPHSFLKSGVSENWGDAQNMNWYLLLRYFSSRGFLWKRP